MTDADGSLRVHQLFNADYMSRLDAATLAHRMTRAQELDDVLAAMTGQYPQILMQRSRSSRLRIVGYRFDQVMLVWWISTGRKRGKPVSRDCDSGCRFAVYAGFDGVFNTTDDFLIEHEAPIAGSIVSINLPAGIFAV